MVLLYFFQQDVFAAYDTANDAVIDLYQRHGLSAEIYTQTTDVEGEVNGLLTYDREVEKFPREWLAKRHRAYSATPN